MKVLIAIRNTCLQLHLPALIFFIDHRANYIVVAERFRRE
jgi:hypothetical protein